MSTVENGNAARVDPNLLEKRSHQDLNDNSAFPKSQLLVVTKYSIQLTGTVASSLFQTGINTAFPTFGPLVNPIIEKSFTELTNSSIQHSDTSVEKVEPVVVKSIQNTKKVVQKVAPKLVQGSSKPQLEQKKV